MSCSGAMYGTVPTMVLTAVSSGAPRSLATPKSTTLTLPSAHRTMFSGFEIAVDDVVRVRGGERGADCADDDQPLVERQRAALAQPRGEVLAVEVLEHDVGRAVLGDVVVVDLDDVGMVERGDDLGLAAEAAQRLLVLLQADAQELDGEALGDAQVSRLVDGAHAPLGDEALEAIGFDQHAADAIHGVHCRRARGRAPRCYGGGHGMQVSRPLVRRRWR